MCSVALYCRLLYCNTVFRCIVQSVLQCILLQLLVILHINLNSSFTCFRYGPVLQFITNNCLLGFYGFTWVSQVLSAIIASERCFCILQPLRSQTVLRTSTMTAIIVAVYVLVVGLYFLVATRYYIVCAYDPLSGSTIRIGGAREFYVQHQTLIDFLDVFVYGLGLPCLVMVVVTTTTMVTAIKLRQAAAWRASTTSSSGNFSAREIALTKKLVWNSVFFIICVFPIALFRSVRIG